MSKVTVTQSVKNTARDRVKAGESRAQVAAAYGVSTRTIGRWIEQATGAVEKPAVASKPAKSKSKKSKKTKAVKGTPVATPTEEVEYRVLATRKSISLTRLVNGAVDGSAVIDRSATNFDTVFAVIRDGGMSEESLKTAFYMCQPKAMVEAFTQGKFQVNVSKNNITYTPDNGVPFEVSGLLSQRIIETITKDGIAGADSLINFLDKLLLNPSNRSVNELYGFVEHNDIVITPTGTFYAWKVVRDDFLDKYTATMDNSVGKEVRVARNQVNEDSDVTCSYGLHACAKSYIRAYGSNGDRVVRVEIDPADVVAVPRDYKNAKLRCSGYHVVADVTKTFQSDLR